MSLTSYRAAPPRDRVVTVLRLAASFHCFVDCVVYIATLTPRDRVVTVLRLAASYHCFVDISPIYNVTRTY